MRFGQPIHSFESFTASRMDDKFHVVCTQAAELAQSLAHVNMICSKHVEAVDRHFGHSPQPLFQCLDFPSLFISGSGESDTQYLALCGLSRFIEQVFRHFKIHGSNLSFRLKQIDQGYDKWKEEAKSILSTLQQLCMSLSLLEDPDRVAPARSQAPKKVAQLLAKGKLGKGDQKKLAKFVADAAADRARRDNRSAYSQIMHVFAGKTEEFKGLLEQMTPVCHMQRRILAEVISALQGTTRQLVEALRASVQELRDSSRHIDFRADFTSFVQRSNLIRYDLLCSPFEPISFSHPVLADIAT
jgi:hypothetical protein